jgi:hypothetical protein
MNCTRLLLWDEVNILSTSLGMPRPFQFVVQIMLAYIE